MRPGSEEKWFRGYDYKPEGKWDSTASKNVKDFEETGHLMFKRISALNRGEMRERRNKDTVHHNGESFNVKLLYRTVHSANQLCVYGAVTNWCETLGKTETVKSTSPDTENRDKNGYVFKDINKNFIMTNVGNSDTKYTNKSDTNNHNAHNLHK